MSSRKSIVSYDVKMHTDCPWYGDPENISRGSTPLGETSALAIAEHILGSEFILPTDKKKAGAAIPSWNCTPAYFTTSIPPLRRMLFAKPAGYSKVSTLSLPVCSYANTYSFEHRGIIRDQTSRRQSSRWLGES
jgi:hypothetical protein